MALVPPGLGGFRIHRTNLVPGSEVIEVCSVELPDLLFGSRRFRVPAVTRLPSGELGYHMVPGRFDDCLRAAVATATQTPIEDVPDPELDERRRSGEDVDEISMSAAVELERWAHRRGWRILVHRRVPVRRARWIGVVASSTAGAFDDHCLVMSYDELLFDPASALLLPAGVSPVPACPSEIAIGLSFQRRGG